MIPNEPLFKEDTFMGDFKNGLLLRPVYRKPISEYNEQELADYHARIEAKKHKLENGGVNWTKVWAWVIAIVCILAIIAGILFVSWGDAKSMAGAFMYMGVITALMFAGKRKAEKEERLNDDG